MKPRGYRVAVVGASSLLGQEILAVLKERDFPVSRLITSDIEEDDPALPVVDLREGFEPVIADENLGEQDLDFIFLAARPRGKNSHSALAGPSFLRSPQQMARARACAVIDACESLASEPGGMVSIPFLKRAGTGPPSLPLEPRDAQAAAFSISAHPAAIVISALLLPLRERWPFRSVVAHVFGPASEIGPQAIEELQKQATSLLSFQKIPLAVFGQQLAFNLLPRIGRGRSRSSPLDDLEQRIQNQLRTCLGDPIPRPALRLFQAPVFNSLAVSLYVELTEGVPVEVLTKALEGDRVHVRQPLDPPPSQVEASGSGDILVDTLEPDPNHREGVWIWAVADNLRLAAINAVEIAEGLYEKVRP
jgi:aspartate-semialdehyde dehydrogenase